MNDFEQWRPVKDYEEFYAVSDKGNVKSLERIVTYKDGRKQHVKERILKPSKDKNDYLFVDLCKNGVKKPHYVHRLVAEAFIPNPCPEKYDIVNHKIEGAEGKLINTVENLEWCDYSYNNNYGTAQERRAKTLTNRPDCSKTVYQYTKDTHELVKEWVSTAEVQRQTGFSTGNISRCCNGEYKTAYGYKWSYTML